MALLFLFFLTTPFLTAQSKKINEIINKEYDFSKIGSMQVDLEFDYEKNRAKTMAMAKATI